MKVNKPKSPFVSGTDTPDEKDIAKAVKGEKFAETLSALESATAGTAASNAARASLAEIAAQYDLSNEENRQSALRESAEFLVKSRLGKEYKKSEKIIKDLSRYVADDPFLKARLLSVLQKLSTQKL
ncbi:MAG: hypothetical protein ACR2HG_10705 [Pyrinomonadaceae bacterium]